MNIRIIAQHANSTCVTKAWRIYVQIWMDARTLYNFKSAYHLRKYTMTQCFRKLLSYNPCSHMKKSTIITTSPHSACIRECLNSRIMYLTEAAMFIYFWNSKI